jgi:regulator of replication initiation timing
VSEAVSSSDVIEGLKEKVSEVIYENAILRAQIAAMKRRTGELEAALEAAEISSKAH